MTSRDESLQLFVDTAVTVAEGADGASICLVTPTDPDPEVATASGEPFRRLDEWQHHSGEGPLVAAIRSRQEKTFIPSMWWWAVFAQQAAELGVRAAWSTPILIGDTAVGAFSLYSTTGARFSASTIERGRRLADLARALATTTGRVSEVERLADNLRQAVGTRDLIGQAKGILMARQNISAEEAFEALRRASQRSHRKLSDVASGVVERHEQPLAGLRRDRVLQALEIADTGRTG